MRKGLFVDDESEMLQAFRKDLPSLCPDVEFDYANSGAQALTLLSMTRYDVVVTDLDMPKMDGVELLSKVAGQHPTAVRILISGHSDWKTNLRVMGPAHECLSKPCSPRDLAESIRQAMKLRDRLKDDRLKRLVSEIHALPTIPSLYLELLKALQDEDAPAERVAGIVSRDMSMSVKILQLVNSSVFGLPQPLSDATEAVIYLGVDTIKSLVLSLQVFSLFERVSVKGFSYGELWTHSLNTGVWSKRISEVENSDPIQVDQSFTAGLLHDVGKLVLAQGLPVRFGKAIELHLSKKHIVVGGRDGNLQCNPCGGGRLSARIMGVARSCRRSGCLAPQSRGGFAFRVLPVNGHTCGQWFDTRKRFPKHPQCPR